MSIERKLNYLKKGGAFASWSLEGYEILSPFISPSGYLKLCKLGIEVPWGSLWANTKLFQYWDNKHD